MSDVRKNIQKAAQKIENAAYYIREGGLIWRQVEQANGDAGWQSDAYEKLQGALSDLEELDMSVGSTQEFESYRESKRNDKQAINESTGLLDANDEDGFMARSQLYFMARDAITLHGMIGDRDELPPWLSAKITKAAEAIEAAREYIEYKKTGVEEVPADAGVSADAEGEFHNELDTLVHDTFGPSPDEQMRGESVIEKEEEPAAPDAERAKRRKEIEAHQARRREMGNDYWNDEAGANGAPKKRRMGGSYGYGDMDEAVVEQAELDDGSKALNPMNVAKNMMKTAKAQAVAKVKKGL